MNKIFFFILSFFCSFSYGQQKCLSPKVIQDQIANAINPQTVIDEFEALKNSQFIPTKSGNIITIPIVFHIVHNGDLEGENENLSDSVILEQLKRINIDFRAKNIDTANIPNEFKPFLADTEIEFCLAKKDTSGNFTNGIIRHNLGQTGWDENAINNSVKPATIWDRNTYLNVWIFNFEGTLATGNVNGYATPPFASTNFDKDGVVLNYTKVGNDLNNDIGRTLVHEIGHWLGLLHIWGDDSGACTGDDGIADTPNQADAYQNCPSGTPNSCGSNDMYMNYMDYTDADCAMLFTIDQKNKMLSVLNDFRLSILSSTACKVSKDLIIEEVIFPEGSICQKSFIPVIKIKNIGTESVNQYGFEFYIDNVLQQSFLMNLSLAPNESKYIQGNLITDETNSLHEAKFIVQSGANDEYSLNNEIIIFYNTINTGGGNSNLSYNFEDAVFPPISLFLENEDNDTTWSKHEAINNHLVMINNSSQTFGNTDAFSTTDFEIDFHLDNLPTLTFDYFYQATPSLSDTLSVYYSLDCGVHWAQFWSKEGLNLSNNISSNTPTIYSNQKLQEVSFSLNKLFNNNAEALKKIRFRFENKSGGGNNLYIDNINFNIILPIKKLNNTKILIYPNPTKEQINITKENNSLLKIELFTLSGELVLKKEIYLKQEFISIKEFPKGVYFLKLFSENDFFIQKIIKN